MTPADQAVERLEAEIQLQLFDALNLEQDFEADDPNADVYRSVVARHRQIAEDLALILSERRKPDPSHGGGRRMSDYLLPILSRMVATRLGYRVEPTANGKFGFTKPGEGGTFGIFATQADAWIDAARSIVEDAEASGREALVERYKEAP